VWISPARNSLFITDSEALILNLNFMKNRGGKTYKIVVGSGEECVERRGQNHVKVLIDELQLGKDRWMCYFVVGSNTILKQFKELLVF
jgi:hypothetical protein